LQRITVFKVFGAPPEKSHLHVAQAKQWRQPHATDAARADASCCAAVGAATRGSAAASAKLSALGRATPAPTAVPSTEHVPSRRPRRYRACRTQPGRAPPPWTRQRWRQLRARATHVARTTANCCAAVGAGACGSATASVRSPPQGRATPAPTAAPPTERRDLLAWRTRARPLQLRRDPPRQLTLQVCASAALICSTRAAKRSWQTQGSATSPQWRRPMRRRLWQTSSAARRVPTVVQR